MIRFDTLDKKPKVWNILVLAVLAAAVQLFLITRDPVSLRAVEITVCVSLALAIMFLIRALIRQIRYNPYSYNTIYYAGFALFLTVGLLAHFSSIAWFRKYHLTGMEGVLTLLGSVLDSAKAFMIISAPFILIFSAGLCVSNVQLIRHEGKRLVNILGILLAFLMVAGEVILILGDRYATGSMWKVMLHDILINGFAAFYLYYECMLIGTIIANLIVVKYKPDYDKAGVIILGCGIRKDGTPTPLLAGRVDRAYDFYREQIKETGKAPMLITSGGQGSDEVTSESAAMAGYLLEKGVPPEHILREERSGSTYENMLFSKEIIEKAGIEGRIAFATTNYHLFRSGLMARRVKMRAVGMGARTKWYFWPNAAVREFVGILTEHRLKQGLILGGMLLSYIIGTVCFYMFL